MAFDVYVFLLVVFLLLCVALLGRLCWFQLQPSHSPGGAIRSATQRLLKPRTPLDCPACRLSCAHSTVVGPAPGPVRPWCEVKSRRGARHSGQHRRLRLSQPPMPLLRYDRRAHSCGFLATAHMARPNRSRRFEVLLAAPRSLPGATLPCTV
jgi:hypothetical protein